MMVVFNQKPYKKPKSAMRAHAFLNLFVKCGTMYSETSGLQCLKFLAVSIPNNNVNIHIDALQS